MCDSENKDIVAFNYYFTHTGQMQLITWTADELPKDEDEWEEFTEDSIDRHYGRSEGVVYIWSYNEEPDIPEKPVIATGPEPMPTWMDRQPPDVGPKPTFTPEKKCHFSPTFHDNLAICCH